MRTVLKIILIVIAAGLLLLLTAQWWLELRFEQIINTSPDRKYNIVYDDIDFKGVFTGLSLEGARIIPRDSTAVEGKTRVNGQLKSADILGVSWLDMFFSNDVRIREITFVEPDFTIYLGQDSSDHHMSAQQSFQDVFRDVLDRAELTKFSLINGSVKVVSVNGSDTANIASVGSFGILANDLQIDSVQLRHLIPFKLGSLITSFSDLSFHLNEYSLLSIGEASFNSAEAEVKITNASMHFKDDWLKITEQMGKQVDMIEFDLKALRIAQLDTKSTFYGQTNIRATSIQIDSLVLTDARNRNIPRPPDTVKPMFTGMLDLIPVSLSIDSINISNSHVAYTEVPEGKQTGGTLEFSEINGRILNVSTDSIRQKMLGSFDADLHALLNGSAPLLFRLRVPYDENNFELNANVTTLNAAVLNKTLTPLASVEIQSGLIENFNLFMRATDFSAASNMKMIYSDLKISVLQKDANNISGLMSVLANAAINEQNLASDKHYAEPAFTTERNVYRGPFHLMWQSIKDGLTIVVPTKAASRLIRKAQQKNSKP